MAATLECLWHPVAELCGTAAEWWHETSTHCNEHVSAGFSHASIAPATR